MLCYSLSLILLPAVGPGLRVKKNTALFNERRALLHHDFVQCRTGTSISFGQPSSRTR